MKWGRISSVVVSLILTVVSIVGAGAAEPEQMDALRDKVSGLLDQLDARTRQERVRAQRELLELGPTVLPLLPAPERLSNASVREAVRRIRLRLERLAATRSVEASVVSLVGEMTLPQAVGQITEQTGNPIELDLLPESLRKRLLSFDIDEQVFWRAMDEICRRAELTYAGRQTADRLSLESASRSDAERDGQTGAAAVVSPAYSHAFRISVVSAERRQLFGDAAHDLLRVRLEVMAEPRLRPLFLKYTGTDLTVVSEATPLEALSPQASQELPLGTRSGPILIQADFKVPSADQIDVVSLAGKLAVETAAGSESFGFGDLEDASVVSRRSGGVTVALRSKQFDEPSPGVARARLRVSVSYDTGGPAFESHRGWVLHNQAFLTEPGGRRIQPSGPINMLLQTDGAVLVEYNFEQLKSQPQEYTFVYAAPTLIVDVPVEFEFKTIPVPLDATERTVP